MGGGLVIEFNCYVSPLLSFFFFRTMQLYTAVRIFIGSSVKPTKSRYGQALLILR